MFDNSLSSFFFATPCKLIISTELTSSSLPNLKYFNCQYTSHHCSFPIFSNIKMPPFVNFTSKTCMEGFTVVIPSVSVGNVGQLTADSLISSFGLKRVATIWDPALVPSVGNENFDGKTTQLCTACELFANKTYKLAVIQIRSVIERKLTLQFLTRLSELLTELKFGECVILTSAFDHEMHDIKAGRFRYATNKDERKCKLEDFDVLPIEDRYGEGFAMKLYATIQTQMVCSVILKYASEGDNRPDAVQMFELVKQVWGFEAIFKFPESWHHVFGNPPPIGVY